MSHGLNIRKDAELDFLSLGALVHRLDPGIIPFRKATECKIHVSGGEFNVAANLSDCFGLRTANRHRHVRLSHRRSDRRAGARHGREAVLQALQARRRDRPQYGCRVQRPRASVCARRWSSTTAATRRRRLLKPGDFDWKAIFAGGVRWVHCGGIFAALSPTTAPLAAEMMKEAKAAGAITSFDLNFREKLWKISGGSEKRRGDHRQDRRERGRAGGQRRGSAEGTGHSRAGGCGQVEARSQRLLRHDRPGGQEASAR